MGICCQLTSIFILKSDHPRNIVLFDSDFFCYFKKGLQYESLNCYEFFEKPSLHKCCFLL